MLTDIEKTVVKKLAEGDLQARPDAEIIFFKNVKEHVDGGRKSVEMNFLSEVFNVSPDYGLRSMYRKKILAQS